MSGLCRGGKGGGGKLGLREEAVAAAREGLRFSKDVQRRRGGRG